MSFDEVYTKYYNELRRFGRQLNLSDVQCEDLTQETYLKFYIELQKDVAFKNPRAWLYRVYLNLFRTHYALVKKVTGSQETFQITEMPGNDINEEFDRNEKHRIVIEVIETLNAREKEILLLYNNGLSYSEMAEILEINPNSVGTTLVRAIEKLKQTLKIHYNEMFEQS